MQIGTAKWHRDMAKFDITITIVTSLPPGGTLYMSHGLLRRTIAGGDDHKQEVKGLNEGLMNGLSEEKRDVDFNRTLLDSVTFLPRGRYNDNGYWACATIG